MGFVRQKSGNRPANQQLPHSRAVPMQHDATQCKRTLRRSKKPALCNRRCLTAIRPYFHRHGWPAPRPSYFVCSMRCATDCAPAPWCYPTKIRKSLTRSTPASKTSIGPKPQPSSTWSTRRPSPNGSWCARRSWKPSASPKVARQRPRRRLRSSDASPRPPGARLLQGL